MRLPGKWMPLLAVLALAACTGPGYVPHPPLSPEADAAWRDIATENDRYRLRHWRDAWVEALARARGAGHVDAIDAEGVLLEPDAALPGPAIPAGDYRCRVIKIGGKSPTMLDYVAYPFFGCRVAEADGVLSFTKLTGSQRPIGTILPETSRRMVFLGTLQLGDEAMHHHYGRDRERDVAALLERIGDARWRMVFPYPHFESTLDVIELVPAG